MSSLWLALWSETGYSVNATVFEFDPCANSESLAIELMHNAVKRSRQASELRGDALPSLFAKQTQAIIESLHGRYYVPFKKMKFWRDIAQ